VLILIVYRGPNKGQVFKLPGDKPRTLGRGVPPVGVTDSKVSTKHCRFTERDGTWWLEDLRSRNGTYVNHVKLDEAVALRDGDRVQLGETRIAVAMAEASPSDSMVGARAITAEADDNDGSYRDLGTGIVVEGDRDSADHAEPDLIGAELDEHDNDEAGQVAAELHAPLQSRQASDDSGASDASQCTGPHAAPQGLAMTGERPVLSPQAAPSSKQSKFIAGAAVLAALVALALGVISVLKPQTPAAPTQPLAVDADALSAELGNAVATRLTEQSAAERETLQQVLARLESLKPGEPVDTDALAQQLAAVMQQDNAATRTLIEQLAAQQEQAMTEARKAQDTAFTREDLQNVLDGQTTLDARLAALTDQLETITDRDSLATAVAEQVSAQVAGMSLSLGDDELSRLREQVVAAVNDSQLNDSLTRAVDDRLAAMTPRLDEITRAIAQQPESEAPWEALTQTMAQLREQVTADAKQQQGVAEALARLERAQADDTEQSQAAGESMQQIRQALVDATRQQGASQATAELEQRITLAVNKALDGMGLATQEQVKLLAAQRLTLNQRIDEALNRITALSGKEAEQTRQLNAVAAQLDNTANDDRPALQQAVAELREVAASLGQPEDRQQASDLTEKIDQLLAQRALLEQVADQTRGLGERTLTPEQVQQLLTEQTTRLESRIAGLKAELDHKPTAGELLAPIRQAIASSAKDTQPQIDQLIAELRRADTASPDQPAGSATDNEQVITAVRDIVAAQGSSTQLLLKELQATLNDSTSTARLAETIQQALDRQASTSRAMLEELNRKLEEKPSADKVVAAVGQALRERTVKTQSLLEQLLAEVNQIEETRAQLNELVQASETGQAERGELRDMTEAVQTLLSQQGRYTIESLGRLEQNAARSNRNAESLAGEVSEQVADRLSRAVSLQLEAAALAGQDSQAEQVAPLLRQVLAELRRRDMTTPEQATPVNDLDPRHLEDAMSNVRYAANPGSWNTTTNPRLERMASPRTTATRGRGYTANATPYRNQQARGLQATRQGETRDFTGDDGLTELQRAYRRAWITNQPVVLSSGGFDAASGVYTEPRILDPVVAREAGITRWQDWYMADDFNERMKLRARVERYRQQTTENKPSARQRDITHIPAVPLPPAQ